MNRKPLAAINITPLVDVLLILLVILMIAMPLFAKRLPVDLPKTSLDAAPAVRTTVKIGLSPAGDFFLDDKKVPEADALAAINSNSSVEIYPDAKVSYDRIAHLVADVQARQPADMALVTR